MVNINLTHLAHWVVYKLVKNYIYYNDNIIYSC